MGCVSNVLLIFLKGALSAPFKKINKKSTIDFLQIKVLGLGLVGAQPPLNLICKRSNLSRPTPAKCKSQMKSALDELAAMIPLQIILSQMGRSD
jgi:hypothetical protein